MLHNQSFIILDAARMGDAIETAKRLNPQYISLFRGKSEEPLDVVAPFLFTFPPKSEFASWFNETGWGNSWGILFSSAGEQNALVSHYQNILFEKTPDRGNMYFRFYDPRVFRNYLIKCSQLQLIVFFSFAGFYICEDENPASGLIFSLQDGSLKSEKIKKKEALEFLLHQ